MSLFMRTIGKCNDSHAPQHRPKRYPAFRPNPISPKDQNMKKYQHNIDARQLHTETTTAVAISK